MSTSKHIDKICCAVLALSLLLTVLFMNGKALGLEASPRELGYESQIGRASCRERVLSHV